MFFTGRILGMQARILSVNSVTVLGILSSLLGSRQMVLMMPPKGFIHFSGSFFSPLIMPTIAPTVAAEQSASSPQLAAMQMLLPRSPSPHSQPISVMPMLLGASKPMWVGAISSGFWSLIFIQQAEKAPGIFANSSLHASFQVLPSL